MDCEKFEPLLLDELYGELDELTSAALKRHVSGCARCSAALNGMRGTRRMVAFPIVDLPEGLEDKIFAATREAQKVVPIRSRASRALSWAGSWAMRPQTAMAAVFLLMIGSSAFLLRTKRDGARESEVSVTVRGEPASAVAAADHDSLDDKAAAAAHGAAIPPTMATASPAAASAVTLADPMPSPMPSPMTGPLDKATGGAARAKDDSSIGALAANAPAKEEAKDSEGDMPSAQKKSARSLEPMNAAAPAGAPPAAVADSMQQRVAPTPAATTGSAVQDGYSAGMAAYRARNYAEAIRQFDAAAQTGDMNSALWAARSVSDSQGCANALPRFEAVAQKAAGSYPGSEALMEAGRCQVNLGQLEGAREKFTRLTSVASHEARARQALANLDQVAARREAERSKAGTTGGGGMASPKAAAPAPAKPASKPSDTANSF